MTNQLPSHPALPADKHQSAARRSRQNLPERVSAVQRAVACVVVPANSRDTGSPVENPKNQTTYSTEECNSTTCFSLNPQCRDHHNRSACTTVNHRNFNKARLRLQRLALLPPALQTPAGIQRQRPGLRKITVILFMPGMASTTFGISTRRCASRQIRSG